MDKYLKSLREMGFSTVTADDVRPPTKTEPLREEIVPAPACGYAALRENVERRLAEAQREINSHTRKTAKSITAHWYGRAAALAVLLQDDDDRTKVPHIEKLCNSPGTGASPKEKTL